MILQRQVKGVTTLKQKAVAIATAFLNNMEKFP